MKIKLNECDKSDREVIASLLVDEFEGRVPADEEEFKKVITEERAEEILKEILDNYKEVGVTVVHTPHDLFVLYDEIMR